MNMIFSTTIVRFTHLAVLLAAAGQCFAGPLEPPAGPVSPSFKTLTEVEPRTAISAGNTPGDSESVFRITQSGSYYLTSDLHVPQGKIGIKVSAEQVTLDLNGFVIAGSSGGSLTLISGGGSDITIRHGNLLRGASGIDLVNSRGTRIEDVTIKFPVDYGIKTGDHAIINRVRIEDAGSLAVRLFSYAVVDHCEVYNGTASVGIYTADHSIVTRSIVRQVAGDGFSMAASSTISDCIASDCGDDGFSVSQTEVTRCTSSDNAVDGFKCFARSIVTDCIATGNGAAGFRPQGTGKLRGNTASLNAVGIRSESGTGLVITENECSDNTSFGLWMNGATGCRIEGNQFYSNGGNGVYLNANGLHFIVRNTARGNSGGNFTFDSSSDYGQIITNPGAGFSNSNPWANFSY